MRRLPIFLLLLACAAGQLAAQGAPVMPAWLVPYPGASAQSKTTETTVESSYTISAAPKEVLAHFQKLFDSQGIPIDFIVAPEGFYLHAEAPECNLDISILHGDKGTAVKMTCTSKVGTVQKVVMASMEDQSDREAANPAKTADKPVSPGGKVAAAGLSWPAWLVRVDGAKLAVQKVAGQLKSSFTAAGPRGDIEAFYIDLLDTNNYQVTKRLPVTADEYGPWVEGTSEPDAKSGKKMVIRVKIRPEGQDFRVEITME